MSLWLSMNPLEIKEEQLTILETIGEGAFAQVFKGTLDAGDSQTMGKKSSRLKSKQHHELHVAVKKLRGNYRLLYISI